MGSQRLHNDFNNVYLTIKSSRSNNNVRKAANRGRAVENYGLSCGKNDEKSGKPVKKLSPSMAEERADALISYFNAPNCREFFLKCIYHLPDEDIYKAIQGSSKPYVKCPVKYFNKTCKIMMLKYGI